MFIKRVLLDSMFLENQTRQGAAQCQYFCTPIMIWPHWRRSLALLETIFAVLFCDLDRQGIKSNFINIWEIMPCILYPFNCTLSLKSRIFLARCWNYRKEVTNELIINVDKLCWHHWSHPTSSSQSHWPPSSFHTRPGPHWIRDHAPCTHLK